MGGPKDRPGAENGGQNRGAYLLTLKEGVGRGARLENGGQNRGAYLLTLKEGVGRGARLEVQNGTQQDLNKMIDLVNFGGQKDRLHAENGDFEMRPNKIWIKW